MPQMMPIKWLNLYCIFTITLILFCLLNYYNTNFKFNKTNQTKQNLYNQNIMHWKW
uniref:ATP synthase complex subunit 8 n=1 Tax=Fergusonina taylori TaxID=991131 RepID=H6TDM8_9MUSC|nr:ATP synthase F0 subunit 8 [Fergusonina taylori]ADY85994.1 ATP synthase F0 subunit 8 [Fergusonina taylori]